MKFSNTYFDVASQQKSQAATVEEISDEEEPTASVKKKKKKPKKKKKLSATVAQFEETLRETVTSVPPPITTAAPVPPPITTAAPVPSNPAPPTPTRQTKTAAKRPPSKASSVRTISSTVHGSSTSIPLSIEQTAQSARTYLKTEGLDADRTKVKTRADHATLFNVPEKKKSIFDRFTKEKAEKPDVDQAGKRSVLSQLSKRPKEWLKQLMSSSDDAKQGSRSMKWDHFVKVSLLIYTARCLLTLASSYKI